MGFGFGVHAHVAHDRGIARDMDGVAAFEANGINGGHGGGIAAYGVGGHEVGVVDNGVDGAVALEVPLVLDDRAVRVVSDARELVYVLEV